RDQLATDGIAARVVSAPSLEWFAEQDDTYREHVLPAAVTARVSIEAGSALSWHAIVGDAGRVIGIDHFGASASAGELQRRFGFTVDAVVAAAHETIEATA
ncbi:MAG: transketolase, partial [Microbacterium sp.]|nr:transketolase [Microbacterium sp.]